MLLKSADLAKTRILLPKKELFCFTRIHSVVMIVLFFFF